MERPLTVSDEGYGLTLKLVDGVAHAALAVGLPLANLDPDALIAVAQRRTGLTDFGDDHFVEPFAVVASQAQQSSMTALARIITRQTFLQALVNRLKLQDYRARHPQVDAVRIDRPLFVLGFPRTGTTALQNLLCLDGDHRGLEFWELNSPVPVHDDHAVDRHRRVRDTNRTLSAAYLIAPEMAAVHEIRATTPEECWPLFFNSFSALNIDLGSGLNAFGDYLLEHDMRPAYADYRRALQLLSWWRPGDLVLKCPEHLWFLDALFAEFPDACVVWTHRDPVASIASYCSLISMQRRMLYGVVDNIKLGRDITDRFLQGVERAMAVRDRVGEHHFYDVDFRDFVKDQAGTVRQIHAQFGIETTDAHETSMADWLDSDRTDHKGAHVYSAERYGLDEDEIRARFATYIERFGLAPVGRSAGQLRRRANG